MRVAITGGIAEGKSTVLQMVADLGHPVVSADHVAREVYDAPDVQAQLAALLSVTPPVDRADLRDRIARDPAIRARVNAIMHPEIVRRLDASPAIFFEIPLLIETCRYFEFDEIWVVTCGEVEQRRRLLARIGDPVQVDRLIATQITSRAKVSFADRVFRTNESRESVRQMVSEATASMTCR